MSISRGTWHAAPQLPVTVHAPGASWGQSDQQAAGQHALVLGGTTFTALEGTPAQLLALVDRMRAAVLELVESGPDPQSEISKTVFEFTVLHRSVLPLSALEDAMAESFDGDAVGLETRSFTVPVPDAKVADELVMLGNDGTFFDDSLLGGVDD